MKSSGPSIWPRNSLRVCIGADEVRIQAAHDRAPDNSLRQGRTAVLQRASRGCRRGNLKWTIAAFRPMCTDDRSRRLLSVPAGGEAQAQRVELDKTFGVALVVDLVFLEGD